MGGSAGCLCKSWDRHRRWGCREGGGGVCGGGREEVQPRSHVVLFRPMIAGIHMRMHVCVGGHAEVCGRSPNGPGCTMIVLYFL